MAARDAQVELRSHDRKVEAKRQLCVMRARRQGPSGRGAITDPTKRIDDLVDYEARWRDEHSALLRALEAAMALLLDWACIDPRGAKVLWRRYLNVRPWAEVAAELGVTREEVERIADVAIDRIDSEGLNVRSRRAKITGAEDAYESD